MKEIGELLGLTRERVRQIESESPPNVGQKGFSASSWSAVTGNHLRLVFTGRDPEHFKRGFVGVRSPFPRCKEVEQIDAIGTGRGEFLSGCTVLIRG